MCSSGNKLGVCIPIMATPYSAQQDTHGGEIGIQVKLRKIDAQRYIELRVQITSATPFSIDDTQIWKPFVKVNGYPVGLSMVLVRQMLSRHNGKISFHKKNASQGILTVLLKV